MKKIVLTVLSAILIVGSIGCIVMGIVQGYQIRKEIKKLDEANKEITNSVIYTTSNPAGERIISSIQHDQIDITNDLDYYLSTLPEELRENEEIKKAWIGGYKSAIENTLKCKIR